MKTYFSLGLALVFALGSPLAAAPAPPLPVGPEIAVNQATLGSHTAPRPALFSGGGFVVVWNDIGARLTLHARFFGPDGAPTGGEFRLLAPSSNSQGVTAVLADRDDSFLVAWEETPLHKPTRVMVQRFRRNGMVAWPAVQVNAPSPRQRLFGHLALVPGGGFVVGWTGEEAQLSHIDGTDFYAYDSFARVFTAGGAPVGPEVVVAGDFDDQILMDLTVGPDRVLTILYKDWDELYSLHLGRRSLTGESLGSSDPQVSAEGPVPGNLAALSQKSDGSLTVAWSPYDFGDNVFSRRFGADGSPLTDHDVQVNLFRGGRQALGSLAALPDGGYVVIWTDYAGRDGSGAGIFARAFGADGQPSFPRDFRVNQTTLDDQSVPLIAGRDGRFVVAWTQSEGNTPAKVRARLLGR